MLNPANVPDVDAEEMTARFVVSKRHINKQTLTLKADAFVPHPYDTLSVTRLIEITEDEIWAVGRDVAAARTPPRTLRGRGDVLAATYVGQENLKVVAEPVEGNPNHANVIGWPSANDETAQVMIAKEIAAVAKFVPPPESE
jgi:hypothetical protein